MASTETTFSQFESLLNQEQQIKEGIRDSVQLLEQSARKLAMEFQAIHHSNSKQTREGMSRNGRAIFEQVRENYKSLSDQIPNGEYYKYLHHWQGISNRLCFHASLLIFIESGNLATRNEVMKILGVSSSRLDGFHIDLEEYLCGLLSLANELSRLAVNSVTMADFQLPLNISSFLNELESGFRLLNLKNDFLRKKYDGLKYDIKKVEQVVYDIKIRNLTPPEMQKQNKKME